MNGIQSEGGSRRVTIEGICPYFFAYGTLRRGARKDLLDFVGSRARLLGHASAPGRLYDLGDYPGMLDPAADEEWVFGDLYQLDDTESVLNRLDEYEGCESGDDGLFRRSLRSVRLEGGGEVEAWIYLYQGNVRDEQRIPSGDYLRGRG